VKFFVQQYAPTWRLIHAPLADADPMPTQTTAEHSIDHECGKTDATWKQQRQPARGSSHFRRGPDVRSAGKIPGQHAPVLAALIQVHIHDLEAMSCARESRINAVASKLRIPTCISIAPGFRVRGAG